MVSDIVVLKDLPDYIKQSVAAYVGCLSGAIKRDRYLKAIEEAGFSNVSIVEETAFPIELILNDPEAKIVMDELKITNEQVEDISKSIVSIKVSAIK
jgi:hypothetical protein